MVKIQYSFIVPVGFFLKSFYIKILLNRMKTITMWFELNIFNNSVKGNVYGKVSSYKYSRLQQQRGFY